jgi:aquaporin Z
VTIAFACRRVFPAAWVVPYWVAQLAGAIGAALLLQAMFGNVSAGGTYPIAKPAGEHHPQYGDGAPEHRPQRRHRCWFDSRATRFVREPDQRRVDEPGALAWPDVVGADYAAWWVYIVGPVIGGAIAVIIIGLVRGLPDKQERDAAQGGGLPS